MAVQPSTSATAPRAPDALLGANLVTARLALGWTQEALSAASRISRATIAQLEAGDSDPRLSTIGALATSIGIPASWLLIGPTEIRAFAGLDAQLKQSSLKLDTREARLIHEWLSGGTSQDRAEIVRVATQRLGAIRPQTAEAQVLACIFTTLVPEPGLEIGWALGSLIASPADSASGSK